MSSKELKRILVDLKGVMDKLMEYLEKEDACDSSCSDNLSARGEVDGCNDHGAGSDESEDSDSDVSGKSQDSGGTESSHDRYNKEEDQISNDEYDDDVNYNGRGDSDPDYDYNADGDYIADYNHNDDNTDYDSDY